MDAMQLRLNSPVGGAPALYQWPLNKKKGYDEAREIIETIVWGCNDIPDLEVPLKKNILQDVDVNSYESMRALTQRYNKAIGNILALEKGTQKFCDRLNQKAGKALLHHIIQQTYSAAVTNAEELNKYQAFSPDVYGETSFDLIAQMIDQIELTKDDVFIDLGSGVGQVVLQIAASCFCSTCIGVERAEVPARYAEAMAKKFKFWMQWYGKRCGQFELRKGDFFDDTHREAFSDATVIFVNNFAFGPSVDHKLKQRFAELKHGTKIISSKSFCPLNFRITDRNLSDIGTIMNISEIAPSTSSVSWTDKPVSYYLHQIDRTKLEAYFLAKKNGAAPLGDSSERSCDSFDTTDSENALRITPPPKRKLLSSKPSKRPESALTNHESSNGAPKHPRVRLNGTIVKLVKKNGVLEPNKSIIRPSKLILDKPLAATTEIPKKRPTGLKRKRSAAYANEPAVGSMQHKLQQLMQGFKQQYLQVVAEMADPSYKGKIAAQMREELIKNMYLKMQIQELDQDIERIIVNMEKSVIRKKC
ncbi:hypothetical protein HUJ04_004290 [Dendroctonus ponderosae]|uniref:Histone-lysine N-methyltransferase, H3 lysine-79 specific n=1 Tax=Dendroctonus ponderosae TaxID=77166 RepID=A0AAR5Q1U1_DENPD|nr:hypothetical protein HUJ04_004290 [Dendroctonus ponderosae]